MFLALHESRGDRRAGFFQSFFKKGKGKHEFRNGALKIKNSFKTRKDPPVRKDENGLS